METREDFLLMKGKKPASRPKKCAKHVQKIVDELFRGLWISEVTPDLYKVDEEQETLGEVLVYYKNTCCLLSRSKDELLLRYELQADNSLLEEYLFPYDASWFQGKMKECLDFWVGNKEPKYVVEDEKWKCGKCQYCKFTSVCP